MLRNVFHGESRENHFGIGHFHWIFRITCCVSEFRRDRVVIIAAAGVIDISAVMNDHVKSDGLAGRQIVISSDAAF